VVHIDEGFVFLGFTIRRLRKRGTQKYYVYTTPSRKAVQAIKGKVSAKTYRSNRHMDLDELIRSLNRTLAGWANHFRYGVSKTTFSAVDHHAWGRLMRWIRAKYKGRTGLSLKNMRRRFCDRGWRFAHNGVMFTGASSVTVTRYRYRGSRSPPRGPRHRQPPPTADHRAETRGEPGTGRPVRRVREGASGKRPVETPAPRPLAYLTDVPRELVTELATLLRTERRARGTRKGNPPADLLPPGAACAGVVAHQGRCPGHRCRVRGAARDGLPLPR
jgi:hypothetical protein